MFGLRTWWEKKKEQIFGEIRSVDPLDEDPRPTTGLAMEDLKRIQLDYRDAVDKFVEQRERWKSMFADGWRAHANAQKMLERRILEIRQASTIASIIWSKMGQESKMEAMHHRRGLHPVGLAAEYERRMLDLEAAMPDETDGPAERAGLIRLLEPAMLGQDSAAKRVLLEHGNDKMFSLIERIEKEGNHWQHRFERQSGMHIQNEAAMIEEIERAQLEFGRFMSALNHVRMERQQSKINNVVELRKLYDEVVK